MTPYDAVMIGAVVAGMIWGAWRGITWQVASIASLVLGYAVAFPVSGRIAPQLPGEPVVARGLAMLAAYVATSGGVFFVAWLIRATLRKLRFEAYDRHLGMLLGGVEGALLGVVVTLFVVSLAPGYRQPVLGSPSGRAVTRLLDAVQPALPGEFRAELAPVWDELHGATPAADGAAEESSGPTAEGRDRPSAGDGAVGRELSDARHWVRDHGPEVRKTLEIGRRILAPEDPSASREDWSGRGGRRAPRRGQDSPRLGGRDDERDVERR